MKEKRKQKNGRGYGSFREVKDKIEGEMEIRPPTHTHANILILSDLVFI